MKQSEAAQKFWNLPEVLESLLLRLDPVSFLQLIQSQMMNKETLQKALSSKVWNRLIKSQEWTSAMQKSTFKVKVIIEGWEEAPRSFEIGDGHLEVIGTGWHRLAQAVGAKFTIKEVEEKNSCSCCDNNNCNRSLENFKLIGNLVKQQNEGLDKLEIPSIGMPSEQNTFLSLVKSCKEWKVQKLYINTMYADINWAKLARSASTGHIGKLEIGIRKGGLQNSGKREEDLKAVWEIAERLEIVWGGSTDWVRVGGGRQGLEEPWRRYLLPSLRNPRTTWEEAYQALLR